MTQLCLFARTPDSSLDITSTVTVVAERVNISCMLVTHLLSASLQKSFIHSFDTISMWIAFHVFRHHNLYAYNSPKSPSKAMYTVPNMSQNYNLTQSSPLISERKYFPILFSPLMVGLGLNVLMFFQCTWTARGWASASSAPSSSTTCRTCSCTSGSSTPRRPSASCSSSAPSSAS